MKHPFEEPIINREVRTDDIRMLGHFHPMIAQHLQIVHRGAMSYEQAMMELVYELARENHELRKELIESKKREMPQPLLVDSDSQILRGPLYVRKDEKREVPMDELNFERIILGIPVKSGEEDRLAWEVELEYQLTDALVLSKEQNQVFTQRYRTWREQLGAERFHEARRETRRYNADYLWSQFLQIQNPYRLRPWLAPQPVRVAPGSRGSAGITRVFMDLEFTGLKRNADLISIALVDEHGRHFYGESSCFDWSKLESFHHEHIIPHLLYKDIDNSRMVLEVKNGYHVKGCTSHLARNIKYFLERYERVQIWVDCGAYDWMLFCELYGGAMGMSEILPNVDYIFRDLCTRLEDVGLDPDLKRSELANSQGEFYTGPQHNALTDAYHLWNCVRLTDRLLPLTTQPHKETEEA